MARPFRMLYTRQPATLAKKVLGAEECVQKVSLVARFSQASK